MRERNAAPPPPDVDRADPDVVIESDGAAFVRSDGAVESFHLDAPRWLTYSDGSTRLTGGVTVTAPDRAGGDGFTMTAAEARIDDGENDFTTRGAVRMEGADGLVAHTGTASYAQDRNLLTMHDPEGPTKLARAGLEAEGTRIAQDRDRWIITIEGAARVRLTGGADRAGVDVAAPRATLADADRYMRFEGGTRIGTGEMTIVSDTATVRLGEAPTTLESIELVGDVRISSAAVSEGGLRESRADETTLHFEPETRRLRQAVLTGESTAELAGADGGNGSRIESGTMEVDWAPGGAEVVGLAAGAGAHLRFPASPGAPRQDIRARALTAAGTPETGLTGISLAGGVEYRERHAASAPGAAATRTVRADRLEAGVNRGLAGLLEVRFDGGVRFEDEDRRASAPGAAYDLAGGTITLSSDADAGPGATLVDGGGTVAAAAAGPDADAGPGATLVDGGGTVAAAAAGPDADAGPGATLVDGHRTIEAGGKLEVALDGSRVSGSGGVQTVLAPPADEAGTAEPDRVPALMDPTRRINVLSDTVDYDDGARLITYGGQARMWQADTSFEGETVAIDHSTGGLSIAGPVRTTIQLLRIDEETGDRVVSRTDAAGGNLLYDDAARRAVFEGTAVLRSDHGDLAADRIEVLLQADGRTLDRLDAAGAVQLRLDGRWATGDTLVYHELEGRYDVEGAPVEIVEEAEPDDPAAAGPSEPTCRSIRGRALTFYRGSDVVTVDGREQARTETSNGPCQPLQF